MKLLVSACLLGECCRYNAKGFNPTALTAPLSGHTLVPVCPERLGGLTAPRSPCERKGRAVYNKLGENVTEAFVKGAEEALLLALAEGCHCALLKEKSPSCGSRRVYDGSFSGNVIAGEGVTAEHLRKHGIFVFSEEQLEELLCWINAREGK